MIGARRRDANRLSIEQQFDLLGVGVDLHRHRRSLQAFGLDERAASANKGVTVTFVSDVIR